MISKSFKSVTAAALSLLTLTVCSCSNDNVAMPDVSDSDGAIRFAAATEFSRAGDITTNNLNSFNVYAYTGTASAPVIFMDNVTVNKTSANVWTYSPLQYWPAKQSVDFYAFAPATWVSSAGPLEPVAYDASAGTEDIVYAVCPDQTGNAGMVNAQVVFNFRHALSKLTVKMSSTNANLKVVVSNVAMTNIKTRGNFNFPTESTAGTPSAQSVGHWTDQNTPSTIILHWSQALSEQLTLTSTPTVIAASGRGRGGEMFVMPQTLSYRSHGLGQDNYIAVQCSIYDAASGERLWPNEHTPEENLVNGSTTGDGMLKFSLSTDRYSEWQPGVHYVYNLVVNSNEEMGAIEFGNPTVDTFIELEQTYE